MSWKFQFKPGQEFELSGVRLVVHSIGRRCLILRPIKNTKCKMKKVDS